MSVLHAAVLSLTLLAACSKENSVDADGSPAQQVGQQCSGGDDLGCGEGARCVLGYCRHGCTDDDACPQGSICVGTSEPFGCTLESEGSCSLSRPCPAGLFCGIDGRCRIPCQMDQDCPRNEHQCIAGACVGEGESGYEESWGECPDEQLIDCVGDGVGSRGREVCNVTAPGWQPFGECPEGSVCGVLSFPTGRLYGACVPDVCSHASATPADLSPCQTDPTCAPCLPASPKSYSYACVEHPYFAGLSRDAVVCADPQMPDCMACASPDPDMAACVDDSCLGCFQGTPECDPQAPTVRAILGRVCAVCSGCEALCSDAGIP